MTSRLLTQPFWSEYVRRKAEGESVYSCPEPEPCEGMVLYFPSAPDKVRDVPLYKGTKSKLHTGKQDEFTYTVTGSLYGGRKP